MRWQPTLTEADFQAIVRAFAVHDTGANAERMEQADQTLTKLKRSYYFAYGAEARKVGDARRLKGAR